jgi:hypothetical protein
MDEKIVLTDPMEEPNNRILETALGKKYKIYQEFINKINEINLVLEWNYYKDEKNWLCKLLNKKKNIGWLSVWDIGFKLTFYFSEKTIEGIYELGIDNQVKKAAREMKPVGKLRPLIITIENSNIIKDAIEILKYKMQLK